MRPPLWIARRLARRHDIPDTQLAALSAEFGTKEHKQRTQGGKALTYISIDATIKRLNEVLGPAWSTQANTTITESDGQYLAVTQLVLTAVVDEIKKDAYGVGAMRNKDADMAVKTALAEALKKAGHQLGIGLYLWDEDAREQVENRMKLDGASDGQLKVAVYNIARQKLGIERPTQAQVAKLFGVKTGDLADGMTNRNILIAEGVL